MIVPELGPSLGRLTDPAPDLPASDAAGTRLDDVRLRLVTGVFELAGAARAFAAAGDAPDAMASLSRVAWLGLWEKAVAAAAERIAASVNARLTDGAAESRFAPRRLSRLLLRPEDTRAMAARLGSGGAPFVAALDGLEQAARAAGSGGEVAPAAWREALALAARRLEAAWLALEVAAASEERRWQADVDRVRSWRRPRWPLWLVSALVLGAAAYLGLVLGGYLPVIPPLEGLARWWWQTW